MASLNGVRDPWRFERTITLGVAVALALQTASALMWAGAVRERLTSWKPARRRPTASMSASPGWKSTASTPARRSQGSNASWMRAGRG